jgi:very-short-patch-repair endonuclease
MSEVAAAAIERLREKLIDLSASNRLLNFRHGAGVSGSQSVLRFIGKSPNQIFARLQEQKGFIVQPVPAPSERDLHDFYHEPGGIPGLESEDARNRARPDPARWAKYLGWDVDYELPVEADESDGEDRRESGRIRTLLFPDHLEARLRRLRSNARLAIEESGSNMLFLALGFLEWVERPTAKPDEDRRPYQAPLILLPATIDTTTNARGLRSFAISWTGEDFQPNLSLKRKLAIDFDVDLPEFFEEDTPDSYFDRVRQAIATQNSWKVRRFATLTLFTNLGKLLLCLDLDPAKWPAGGEPADHLIVRSLIGDRDQRSAEGSQPLDDRAAAKQVDLDLCLVDRADETQARALLKALNGENLVIQGPPGTGKSQTITNLIAAALDRGKTVLFVAEKLAALEVVKRRLREVGLGDFCLELHSHKTRKKTFFDDVAIRLSKTAKGSPANFENALAALAARRAELDHYASAIGRPAGQTGYKIADLLFEAGRVRATNPVLARKIDENGLTEQVRARGDTLSIDSYSSHDAVRSLRQAVQALRHLAPFGGPLRSPWRGVEAQALAINPRVAHNPLANWRDKARAAGLAILELNAEAGLALTSQSSTFQELSKLADCPLDLPGIFSLTAEVRAVFNELADVFGLTLNPSLQGFLHATRLVNLINSASDDTLRYGAHEGLDAPDAEAALNRLGQALQRRAELVASLRGRIDRPDAENLDERGLRAAAKVLKEASLFARLGREWREARRLARALAALGAPKNPREQGDALLLLAERVAIDFELGNDAGIRNVCGIHFRGAATDTTGLRRAIHWRETVKAEFGDRRERQTREVLLGVLPEDAADIRERAATPLTKLMAHAGQILIGQKLHPQTGLWVAVVSAVASGVLADTLGSQKTEQDVANFIMRIKRTAVVGKELEEAQQHAMELLSINPTIWFGSPDEWTAEDAAERASEALDAPDALIPWLTYARARSEVRQPCAGPLLEAVENGVIDPDDVEQAWQISLLADAARRLHAAEPILLRFGGLQLNDIRKEYARLDGSVMELRQRVVSARLMLRRPPVGIRSPKTKEMTELALLDHCINMQKRHPAIRDVTARAGKALQSLKPCFMMGPLSVAQYITPGTLSFDLVIMDEASQIRPEDAIGAVARGDQLVVVGDDKQLPPTSFFDRLSADGDGGFVGQDDESILVLANSAFRGEQGMLRWHYRSRHPELIAFSNHQFYDDQLVVFPAPSESNGQIGLSRIFVGDGCVSDGVNDAEARAVAQAAIDHLRTRPDKSLMVVAMNIRQKERIEEHIGRLETTNGGLGKILDENEGETRIEPFVVKNLENVQGDERDVVMISMTYGPRQPGGRVEQYFGPINQDKGHRRLNVLFTRAKEQMVVFTSMRVSDIQAGPQSSSGLYALQAFLRFAETKQLPSGSRLTGKSPESPFEEAVAQELERAGYRVEPQLGVGHYRIDVAVRNPDAPQQFLLGIECDGAMYHSTLSARDRDRLRQEVLENLGWEIERIWSVDWFQNPAGELKRVLARLERLRGPRDVEQPQSQVSEEISKRFEDTGVEPAPDRGRVTQTHGIPYQLKAALTNRSATGIGAKRVLTREEMRAALIALREKIDSEYPDVDPLRNVLRQSMLEELLRKRPTDADEWRAKIPLDLRQGTDGEQFKRYSEDIFEILAGRKVTLSISVPDAVG